MGWIDTWVHGLLLTAVLLPFSMLILAFIGMCLWVGFVFLMLALSSIFG